MHAKTAKGGSRLEQSGFAPQWPQPPATFYHKGISAEFVKMNDALPCGPWAYLIALAEIPMPCNALQTFQNWHPFRHS